ncbi:uncharacterized protein LOC129778935 isoform X2 [Toxorhynchites rutilus septentrionalis]|uniref:uncharacterized protein LOC129778935 isoform X2 n=1 Tax=Toxorhynchites rutilus septentrionalis TaxID=329112 RepID=UPI002479C4DE|nr:uncharacterized protein LOC129778935 isoform X2 [Toxorhynchites rutilus septentrionalis]
MYSAYNKNRSFSSNIDMAATPDRLNISRGRIQSPRTPSSPSATVGASCVADCVRKYVDLHKKWQITVLKGAQYCSAIENIKKGVLESKEEEPNPYPDNLQLYCKNLAVLNTILEDVVTSLGNMIQQLRVLQVALKDDTVGKSWNIRQTLVALCKVYEYFQADLITRRRINTLVML